MKDGMWMDAALHMSSSGGSIVLEALLDALTDGLKMLPVLYISYLLMEILEHRASEKMTRTIAGVGRFGPLLGAFLGAVPQCGFSGAIASLYSVGLATEGTMIAVFLSTSDEMLPLLLSSGTSAAIIVRILLFKVACGIVFGYLLDLIRRLRKRRRAEHINDLCEQDHCECEGHNVFLSAAIHCLKTMIVILVVSFALNLVFALGGEETAASLLPSAPFLSEMMAALVGLIPSCAVSVAFTSLFIKGVIGIGPLVSALAANAGVGLVVLYRQNRPIRDSLRVTALLYVCGVLSGAAAALLNVA